MNRSTREWFPLAESVEARSGQASFFGRTLDSARKVEFEVTKEGHAPPPVRGISNSPAIPYAGRTGNFGSACVLGGGRTSLAELPLQGVRATLKLPGLAPKRRRPWGGACNPAGAAAEVDELRKSKGAGHDPPRT
jgi:hypothetical protein